MAVTLSLINMKGGVGKTTVAAQLAHAADRANLRTLAIDLDPQANLSQSLLGAYGYVNHLRSRRLTIDDLMKQFVRPRMRKTSPRSVGIRDVIVENAGYWRDTRLDLIPSQLELARTLKNSAIDVEVLARSIATIEDHYDLILIDCAPTESLLTEAAYHASRYLIVPVKPEYLATIGLPLLARSLDQFRSENPQHDLDIAGIVFNHGDYQVGHDGKASLGEVRNEAEKNGWPVFQTHIRHSKSFPRAARSATPIEQTSYARYEVTREFMKFANEVFDTIGLRSK